MKILILSFLICVTFFCLADQKGKNTVSLANCLKEQLNFKKKSIMAIQAIHGISILGSFYFAYRLFFNGVLSDYEDLKYSRLLFSSTAIVFGSTLYERHLDKNILEIEKELIEKTT